MGAWGIGSFENDTAMDFVGDLEGEGLAPIEAALTAVLEAAGEVEASAACEALAAAEAVAVLRNRAAPELPPEVREWAKVGQRVRLTSAFFDRAKRAVERVRDQSELAQLWAESDEAPAWRAGVEDLLARLG